MRRQEESPVNLLSNATPMTRALLARSVRDYGSARDMYLSHYAQASEDQFPSTHPMARVNQMLGELSAINHLLYGILQGTHDDKHQLAIAAIFNPMTDQIERLARSLRYEKAILSSEEEPVKNCCTIPAEWAESLMKIATHLQDMESHTSKRTLGSSPVANQMLHEFLEGGIYSRMFTLIGRMERDVNEWNAAVAKPQSSAGKLAGGRVRGFKETNETIVGAAIPDPHSNVVAFPFPKGKMER
jgi:hypothetical protein